MKKALTLALLCALAVSPALARGASDQQSGMQSSQASQHTSMNQNTVRQLQQQLQSQGYEIGQVDGVMGPQTRQALTDFQRDQNLQPTGQPDQQTMAALGVEPGSPQQAEIPQNPQQQRQRSLEEPQQNMEEPQQEQRR